MKCFIQMVLSGPAPFTNRTWIEQQFTNTRQQKMNVAFKCLSVNLQVPNSRSSQAILRSVDTQFGKNHAVIAFQGVGCDDHTTVKEVFGQAYNISEFPKSDQAFQSSVLLVSKASAWDVAFDYYQFGESISQYCGATFATLFNNKKKLLVMGSTELDQPARDHVSPIRVWQKQLVELGELLMDEPNCIVMANLGFSDHQRAQQHLFKMLQGGWRDIFAPPRGRTTCKTTFTNSPNRRDDRILIKGQDVKVTYKRNYQECWNPELRDQLERNYVSLQRQGRFHESAQVSQKLESLPMLFARRSPLVACIDLHALASAADGSSRTEHEASKRKASL